MTTKPWFCKPSGRARDVRGQVGTSLVALLGVVLMAGMWWTVRDRVFRGLNDFVMFYASTRLVGSPDLYNVDLLQQVEREATGAYGQYLQYTRLPFQAALIWPLGRLPYRAAYVAWQGLSFAAVILFIGLWPDPNRRAALLGCCWSVPLSSSFANAQDCAFLLLWIVLALRLYRERPFLAGMVLSLCAAKFQLFLLIPWLILLQRRWRMAAGLVAGGALVLAVCFAGGGPSWPLDYYRALPRVAPGEHIMPNLHGLLLQAPHALALELVLAASVVAAVGIVAQRSSFEIGMAAALAGGLLVSYHAYPADAILLLPAVFFVLSRAPGAWLRGLAFALLLPVWYYFLMAGGRLGDPLRLGTLLMVYAMAVQAWRTGTSTAESQVSGNGTRFVW